MVHAAWAMCLSLRHAHGDGTVGTGQGRVEVAQGLAIGGAAIRLAAGPCAFHCTKHQQLLC